MFINTANPDLQSFDPTKSGQYELPPLGIYNEQFKIVGTQDGKTKSGHGKLDITFEMLTGALSGFQFQLTYNVGHSNPDTAKWAIQDLMKIGYGTTGNKNYGRDGGGFDTNDLYNKPFSATLDVHEQKGGNVDSNGKPYSQARFKKIEPISANANQPQPTSQPAQSQPTSETGVAASWGQPQ